MQSLLAIFTVYLTFGLASELQGDVVKDPYNLCSSPLEELESLDLIELRQYETFGERVILCHVLGNLHCKSMRTASIFRKLRPSFYR